MPTFNDLTSLFNYIENVIITDCLQKEVYETVKEVEKRHIEKDVYDVYQPMVYNLADGMPARRRGKDGGLIADENIVGEVIGDTLSVKNKTIAAPHYVDFFLGEIVDSKNKGKPLAPMIEEGGGPNYDFPDPTCKYYYPRPFTKNTYEELKNTEEHIVAFKKGLKRLGVKVSKE